MKKFTKGLLLGSFVGFILGIIFIFLLGTILQKARPVEYNEIVVDSIPVDTFAQPHPISSRRG